MNDLRSADDITQMKGFCINMSMLVQNTIFIVSQHKDNDRGICSDSPSEQLIATVAVLGMKSFSTIDRLQHIFSILEWHCLPAQCKHNSFIDRQRLISLIITGPFVLLTVVYCCVMIRIAASERKADLHSYTLLATSTRSFLIIYSFPFIPGPDIINIMFSWLIKSIFYLFYYWNGNETFQHLFHLFLFLFPRARHKCFENIERPKNSIFVTESGY